MIENMLLNHISGISDLICNPHLSSFFLHQYLNAIIRPFIYNECIFMTFHHNNNNNNWKMMHMDSWTSWILLLEVPCFTCFIPSLKARGSQVDVCHGMFFKEFLPRVGTCFFFATIASSIKIVTVTLKVFHHFRVGNPCGFGWCMRGGKVYSSR